MRPLQSAAVGASFLTSEITAGIAEAQEENLARNSAVRGSGIRIVIGRTRQLCSRCCIESHFRVQLYAALTGGDAARGFYLQGSCKHRGDGGVYTPSKLVGPIDAAAMTADSELSVRLTVVSTLAAAAY